VVVQDRLVPLDLRVPPVPQARPDLLARRVAQVALVVLAEPVQRVRLVQLDPRGQLGEPVAQGELEQAGQPVPPDQQVQLVRPALRPQLMFKSSRVLVLGRCRPGQKPLP
jgi:hypothetical protein